MNKTLTSTPALALLATLTATGLATATPAWGEKLYVPYAAKATLHGDSFRTEIRVYNDTDAPKALRYVFLEAGLSYDDVDTASLATEVSVGSKATAIFDDWVPSGKVGWIDVDADSGLFVTARLIGREGTTDTAGTEVPVVTSQQAVQPGITTVVAGVDRETSEATSDLYMLNFGSALNQCAIEAYSPAGAAIFSTSSLAQPGAILTQFLDVVELLGFEDASDLALAFTCTQPFYPFVVTQALDTGEARFHAPAAGSDSGFIDPGPGGGECGSTSVCFEKNGVFHTPTGGNPVLRLSTTPPPGTYRQVRVQLSVTNGGWSGPSGAAHGVFWFVRDKNKDMVGYVAIKSPGSNELFLRHGFGLTHGEKPKVTQKLNWTPGTTLHFDYVYDPGQHLIELTLTNGSGQQVAHLTSAPNISALDVSASNKMIFDFGASGENPSEPTPVGWKYSDLRVEFRR